MRRLLVAAAVSLASASEPFSWAALHARTSYSLKNQIITQSLNCVFRRDIWNPIGNGHLTFYNDSTRVYVSTIEQSYAKTIKRNLM